jgi:transcriptional regulator
MSQTALAATDNNLDSLESERLERHDYWEAYLKEWTDKNTVRANLIELSNPFSAITALMLMEKGESRSSIAKKLGWNWITASKFEERHTLTIQENRKSFSRRFAMTVSSGLDVLNRKFQQLMEDDEALTKADVKGIAIAVGVMTDKGAMMDGMATQYVEHRKAEANVGDAFDFIMKAKERAAQKQITIEAEVIQ